MTPSSLHTSRIARQKRLTVKLVSRTLLVLTLLAATGKVLAQTTPTAASSPPAADKLPTYDVSTIRPNTSGSDNVSVNTRPATLQAENVPVKDLLRQAFGVPRDLIFGIPAWAENARFDVNAKIVDPDLPSLKKLTPEQRRTMLQALYEDRFSLKWHYETRVMPTFELLLTRDGPKFKPFAGREGNNRVSMNNTDLTATAVPLSALTDILSAEVERPVVDKTGLTGKYDFHLKWTREQVAASADAGKDTDAAPPLFTALQEQLGLKLQPGKDPVQVLVIDQLKPPTEN